MKLALRIVAGVVVLLVLVAAGGWLYVRTSLPKTRGTVTLTGLKQPVDIVRDANDVPHIYAKDIPDALFALGYVHAQDRLWQMDFQRRVGEGTLSEVLGKATVPTDEFLRTLGVYRAAQQALDHVDTQTRTRLDAYVAGINAYIDTHKGAWPPEYLVLGVKPQHFAPADVIAWAKMMSWDLSGNWSTELLRARLIAKLEPKDAQALIATLWPAYPKDGPVVVPNFQALYRQLPLGALAGVAPAPPPPGLGSNDWVVAGSRTASGKPLLANDPHLELDAPSLWYLAQISAPGLNVIGATLPGTPAVLLGRNERIAWGFTNTGPDTQDLFIEKVDPSDPSRYLTPDGSQPFRTRREVIHVKGADDVVLNVRSTRHGPVISDVTKDAAAVAKEHGSGYVIAMQWTALEPDDTTIQAVMEMNSAHNWTEFEAALKDFVTPEQNIVYADVDGNIGYYAPGRIPVRRHGDGSVPVPGWTGAYDWVGTIPFDALPHTFDPASGRVVTANNKVVPDSYPYYLTRDWTVPYRAERITSLLDGTPKATVHTMEQIQADQSSLLARAFLPTLRGIDPPSELAAAAQAQLVNWNGDMNRDASAPLIFAAWYRAFSKRVYGDEMGDLFDAYFGFHPRFLQRVLTSDQSWCDDVTTPGIETCAQEAAAALQDAVTQLSRSQGKDPARWRWGRVHRAYSAHQVFTNTPLARFFDLSIANGGGAFTVDVGRYDMADAKHPYRQIVGPGYRAVYDLAQPDASRFMQTTGQSGNPLSKHYGDFLRRWRDVRYLPMSMRRADAERGRIGTLTLAPAPPE
ncbi:MAG TPA: penicillin acylase family protein [Trueperaceae bacterium]|nr:penicillin acylase family protein [Trueperaceae bacterium]